jgi:hypothetical protein
MHIEKITQVNILLCLSMSNSNITSDEGNTKLVLPPAKKLPDAPLTQGGDAIYMFCLFLFFILFLL